MSVNLSPLGGAGAQFFSNNGVPLAGGLLYTYLAGTSTPATAYTSSNGLTPLANPIVLDSAGRVPTGEIWLTDGISYKFVLKDATDVLIATWDNLSGINSNFISYTAQQETATATAGQTVFNLALDYVPGANNLAVFVNGSKQIVTTNYTETDSNTVTFLTGLNVGDLVQFSTATPVAANAVSSDNVSYLPAGASAVVTTVQSKLRSYVSLKDFGAVGDGVTDDTAAIQLAINAITDGRWLDGNNLTYLVTSQITASGINFNLANANFVTTTTYASQGSFVVTSTYIELDNVSVDGGRGTYKTGSETWSVFTTFNGYSSIAPTLNSFFDITKYDALCRVNINNVNFYNMFANSCIQIGTYGTVFINNCEYKNIANKTFHVYHSPDDGVTQAGRTLVSNVYAEDVGILPTAYLVGNIAKTRADAFAPQGSFNFIVSHGNYTINNAEVKNYASCGVTADRNLSFNSNNVYISNSSAFSFSNNPSGAFWLELCPNANVSNLIVDISNRDSRDTALDSSALQLYVGDNSQTNIANLIILGNNSTAKVRKHVRGSVKDNATVFINNFYVSGLTTSLANAISFALLPNAVIESNINLSDGLLQSGSITIEQPYEANINNVQVIGADGSGNVYIALAGNPGITGTVATVQISDSNINGLISSTVNVTRSLKINSNKYIGSSISSSASSGTISVSDNTYIGGSLDLTGASATSGIAHVLGNGTLNGITTLFSGKNGRVSNNTTNRRIEIKDVQTFEIIGNTAKTNAAEPIIWINPVTAANILAGVISSNNVLIKTGTVGAGYISIGGGVTGVTNVNNNQLTVNWS